MDSPGLIYAAIPKVMADVGAVTKDRKNPQQGYSFRSIDDIYFAAQPALIKHGVFCAPEVLEQAREERTNQKGTVITFVILRIRHRFYASDGSFIDVVTIGEAMDSGDKASNKAMSAAMKYALIELLAIPTEDDNDTENSSHEVQPRQGPPPQTRPQSAAPRQPPDELGAELTQLREDIDGAKTAANYRLIATRIGKLPEAEIKAPAVYAILRAPDHACLGELAAMLKERIPAQHPDRAAMLKAYADRKAQLSGNGNGAPPPAAA